MCARGQQTNILWFQSQMLLSSVVCDVLLCASNESRDTHHMPCVGSEICWNLSTGIVIDFGSFTIEVFPSTKMVAKSSNHCVFELASIWRSRGKMHSPFRLQRGVEKKSQYARICLDPTAVVHVIAILLRKRLHNSLCQLRKSVAAKWRIKINSRRVTMDGSFHDALCQQR